VTVARAAAQYLTPARELEALGDGFSGLEHGGRASASGDGVKLGFLEKMGFCFGRRCRTRVLEESGFCFEGRCGVRVLGFTSEGGVKSGSFGGCFFWGDGPFRRKSAFFGEKGRGLRSRGASRPAGSADGPSPHSPPIATALFQPSVLPPYAPSVNPSVR
jgi:hypothetical protein